MSSFNSGYGQHRGGYEATRQFDDNNGGDYSYSSQRRQPAVPMNAQPFVPSNRDSSITGGRTPTRQASDTPSYNTAVKSPASRADPSRSRTNDLRAAGIDEKKPTNDSAYTLADEYDDAIDKGFKPSAQTRGSMALQMAAAGEIPKKAGLRMWRSEEHQGVFLRGGKARACGRCCLCSTILAILIIIAAVCAFFLWVRPPYISFNGVETPAGLQQVVIVDGGFQINLNLNVGVINPNTFGAFFPQIDAKAFYPTDPDAELGGGTMNNVDIPRRTNNTIHFPFQINYTSTIDPNSAILNDIATKCGFIQGSTPQQIRVLYTLKLKVKVVAVTISPSFSSSATFPCPLKESDIDSLLKAGGVEGILSEVSGGGGTNSANGRGGDRLAKRFEGGTFEEAMLALRDLRPPVLDER